MRSSARLVPTWYGFGVPAHHAACAASPAKTTTRPFLTASIATEIGALLALSVMFPFMIHILPLPEDTRWGPRLLPMFYAPLIAALVGRTQSACVVALGAPWLNWLLTSHPTPLRGVMMTLQLVVFVVTLRALLGKTGPRWFLAAPAYVAAMLASAAVGLVFPALVDGRPAGLWLVQTVTLALPGVAVMLLINGLVVLLYPSGGDGSGPRAA